MKKLIGLKGGQDGTFFEILDSQKVDNIVRYPSIKDGKEVDFKLGFSEAELKEFMANKQKVSYIGYRLTVAGNAVSAEQALQEMGYRAGAINQNTVEILLKQVHGGPREGAGRPATGAKPSRTFRLDDDEYKKVKEFIKMLRGSDNMFNKTFTTYSPENHGLETGSNNGNYAEYASFRAENNQYWVKYWDSSEGDMSPYSEWQELSLEEWLQAYAKAAIEEHVDFECHAPDGKYELRQL